MQSLRIAMLAPFGITPKGTLLARMLPLAQALQDQGHLVHIIAPAVHNPQDAGSSVVHGGVLVTHIAATTLPSMLGVAQQSHLLWRTARDWQPDILHVFKPKGHAGLAGWWARLVAPQLPLVVDCDDREGTGGWNDVLPYPAGAKALFAWQEDDLPRRADAVTVASRTLQSLVWASGVPATATVYLPNAANIPQQTAPALRTAPVLVLYTRFWEFELTALMTTLMHIVAQRPDIHLHIIGSGENGEEQQCATLLHERQLHTHVTMHGWMQPAHIPAVLAQASIALVPVADTLINRSRCSAKLLELLAAGLVVVGHDVGEMRTFIEHGHSGLLVAPDQHEAFAHQVCMLLDQPDTLQQMQQHAHQSAQQHAWATRVAACEHAYAHALDAQGR